MIDRSAQLSNRLNEVQTASLETALLHAASSRERADPDANRSAGLQSHRVSLEGSSHHGLVELARRRSDLSVHLCRLSAQGRASERAHAVAGTAHGLTLT